MASEKFTNGAYTTLATAAAAGDSTISVSSAALFPTAGNFRIAVDRELMLVTGVSGTTFTVTRGIESTTAVAHSYNAPVIGVITAGAINALKTDVSILFGDQKPTTAGAYDEEFDGAINTLPANWSWGTAPSGSDAWFVNTTTLPSCLYIYGNGDGSYNLTRSSFTPGTGSFGVWTKILLGPAVSTKCDFRFYIFNSGSTEGRCVEYYPTALNTANIRALQTVSNTETVWAGPNGVSPHVTEMYFGLTRTSGNSWTGWVSSNGISWQQIGAPTTHSFTVDHILLKFDTASIKTLTGVDWVRYRTDTEFPIH